MTTATQPAAVSDPAADRHSLTVTITGSGPVLYGWRCVCGLAGHGEAPCGSTPDGVRARAQRDHDTHDDADDLVSITVTIKMTSDQRDRYADEYGDFTDDAGRTQHARVRADIRERLTSDGPYLLGGCYWLREFASYSVTQPE